MNIWKGLRSPALPPIFTWEYVVSALLLATVLSRGFAALYEGLVPQKYPQFVVGELAWDVGSKQPDYLILVGFVGFFFAIHLGLRGLAGKIQTVNGASSEAGFRDILMYSSLPAAAWIGHIFVNSQPTLDLVILSAVLLILTIAFAVGFLVKELQCPSADDYRACVGSSLLIILFAALGGTALTLAIARLNLNWQLTDTHVIVSSAIVGVIFISLLLTIWVWKQDRLVILQKRLRSLLGWAQCLLPLSFFVLIPTPWINGQQRFYGYELSPALYGLIAILLVISYADIFRRLRQKPDKDETQSVFSVLSPLCLIAVLVYIKSPIVGVSYIAPDDYHWGEFLLPWWLFKNFGHLPYVDYEPARGLINYVPAFLGSLLFNDKAPAYIAVSARAPQILPYIAIAFGVISRSIGVLPTFLLLAVMPNPNNVYEIDLMLAVGVCLLAELFLKHRPVTWLGAWLFSGVGLILFAPGQGGLFLIATFPLAAVMGYKAIRFQRPFLLRGAIAVLGVAILVALLTPVEQILWGALRYGLEQSSLNTVAYGIEWVKSTGSNTFQTYPLWEFFRTSWIVVTVAIGLLIYQAVTQPPIAASRRFLVFAIPLFLLTLLIIPRAAGRIDAANFSRLGTTSVWVMSVVLPIVLVCRFGERSKALILLTVAILGSLLSSGMGEPLPYFERLAQHPILTLNVAGMNFVDGAQTGLPNLDGALLEPEHQQRLQRLKGVISTVLDPGETYLDLTSRSARYFHLNYPPPMPGAAFNLVHLNQQRRTIAQVESQAVPLVVAIGDGFSETHSVALRNPLLYRYAVENFIPFKIDEFIFMIRPEYRDRLDRLRQSFQGEVPSNLLTSDTEAQQLALLDRSFRVTNLVNIPTSWGRSLPSLQAVMQPVQDLATVQPTLKDITQKSDRYQVTGANPRLTFDVSTFNLEGWKTGLLKFDYTCHSRSEGALTIRWATQDGTSEDNFMRLSPRKGTQIVPLDAAPRWLLAKGIKTITLEPLDNVCPDFTLKNVGVYQRSL